MKYVEEVPGLRDNDRQIASHLRQAIITAYNMAGDDLTAAKKLARIFSLILDREGDKFRYQFIKRLER